MTMQSQAVVAAALFTLFAATYVAFAAFVHQALPHWKRHHSGRDRVGRLGVAILMAFLMQHAVAGFAACVAAWCVAGRFVG
jgi:hypothetical protein